MLLALYVITKSMLNHRLGETVIASMYFMLAMCMHVANACVVWPETYEVVSGAETLLALKDMNLLLYSTEAAGLLLWATVVIRVVVRK